MLFKVQTPEGEIELTTSQLLDVLMSKHMQVNRRDFEVMSLEFAKFMQFKEALHEATLLQIILIAFSLGYFYRVFKEKNDVEVCNEPNPTPASSSPTS